MRALVLHVRLHDGRYHGKGDWPPSPARLFQALVAGAGLGGPLKNHEHEALRWLERQAAPIIAAPNAWQSRHGVLFYMPNNDSDAISGDPLRMSKIRTAIKTFRPYFFDAAVPFLYMWPVEQRSDNEKQAMLICSLAERVYQLGRGVDFAWAWGEVLEHEISETKLSEHPGVIYRPCEGSGRVRLPCPQHGSLESLVKRHKQFGERFMVEKNDTVTLLYKKPDPPRFQNVSYGSPPAYLLFDLRDTAKSDAPFVAWPIERCTELAIKLRGEVDANGTPTSGAAKRLWDALPSQRGEIARVLIGRDATDADKSRRMRILPLPSIGHAQVDRGIRRVLIEIPANCPLHRDDVAWAFSGLEVSPADFDSNTGEIFSSPQLVPAQERDMLRHYGIETGKPARTWRSVTPLALPESARRRRIDPEQQREEAKNGSERRTEHERAAAAVLQALRHASIRTPVLSIRAQREPFEAKGAHAEVFAAGTRFDKRRLWHVELNFVEPVCGPLVLGDGRYCGLGLMAPAEDASVGLYAFRIVGGLADAAKAGAIAQALRRAMMARVQALLGDGQALPSFFSGHAANGDPLRNGNHQHLAFVADLAGHRLLIVAPHRFEHRVATFEEKRHLQELERALVGLYELRAGAAGRLRLIPEGIHAEDDPLLAPSFQWVSRRYLSTRRAKGDTHAFVQQDVRAELSRRGFPVPISIDVRNACVAGAGLVRAEVTITFGVAVAGPVLLGRDLHLGGGCFRRQHPLATPDGAGSAM